MHSGAILKCPVTRVNSILRETEARNYYVRPALRHEVPHIVWLYNAVLDLAHERGLMIHPRQIEARLDRDPASVLLGFFEGEEALGPVSLINILKLWLYGLGAIPPTHAELTGEDLWTTSTPQHFNTLICPWIATHIDRGRGWTGEYLGRQRSIGQLQVMAVGAAAELAGNMVDGIVAYSRPGGLRSYLEKEWKGKFAFPAPGRLEFPGYPALDVDASGLLYSAEQIRLLELLKYWDTLNPVTQRRIDLVYRMHGENGARFETKLRFPRGQIHDQNSLYFRTGLVYKADFK